jgi:hypothetical protein
MKTVKTIRTVEKVISVCSLVITSACRETRFLADLRCLLECLSFRLVFHIYYLSKERI